MTGTLLYEIQAPGRADWKTVAVLRAADREGSLTDITEPGTRDVVMFRCEGDRSVISRSAAGIDFEAGPVRVLLPLEGREILAELGDGQSCEREMRSDRGIAYRARWTHRNHGA